MHFSRILAQKKNKQIWPKFDSPPHTHVYMRVCVCVNTRVAQRLSAQKMELICRVQILGEVIAFAFVQILLKYYELLYSHPTQRLITGQNGFPNVGWQPDQEKGNIAFQTVWIATLLHKNHRIYQKTHLVEKQAQGLFKHRSPTRTCYQRFNLFQPLRHSTFMEDASDAS